MMSKKLKKLSALMLASVVLTASLAGCSAESEASFETIAFLAGLYFPIPK